MENKRQYTRVLFSTPAVLKVDHKVFDTSIIDLSLKGALISTPDSLGDNTGAEATLEFVLEGSEVHIDMQGNIAHCEPQSVGLTWSKIDIESMTHLRRLLELNVGDADLLERQLENLSVSD
ncbi:PilZ domain-containing protein [Psychrosphaera haliotis]|uniref:Cyclic diguanosine monophosphate-binding protein n=1 Tax=Psychrosphaera haliotis TaxID=555083 RepID=A0A6N8FBL4_9GAMM|nr:PilZ domain-containing protein [Psychrosphaera haliotis]MUH72142.1 PilZ domain-containing protein [Psychrosphaera haliotis]